MRNLKKYTKYDIARMLGAGALQLSMGAPFMFILTKQDLERMRYSTVEIAKLELEKSVLPITVRRPLPELPAEYKNEQNIEKDVNENPKGSEADKQEAGVA